MQLIGQKDNLALINSWETMPPFTIIQGDEHTGKNYLVLYLCKKFKLFYTLVSNDVDTIRDMINHMKKGSKMLYHFDNFDTASIQAKNALLKITEEPIEGNYIVITGGPQIKTLESRARKLLMNPYTQDEIFNYMNNLYPDIETKKLLYKCRYKYSS